MGEALQGAINLEMAMARNRDPWRLILRKTMAQLGLFQQM